MTNSKILWLMNVDCPGIKALDDLSIVIVLVLDYNHLVNILATQDRRIESLELTCSIASYKTNTYLLFCLSEHYL